MISHALWVSKTAVHPDLIQPPYTSSEYQCVHTMTTEINIEDSFVKMDQIVVDKMLLAKQISKSLPCAECSLTGLTRTSTY